MHTDLSTQYWTVKAKLHFYLDYVLLYNDPQQQEIVRGTTKVRCVWF